MTQLVLLHPASMTLSMSKAAAKLQKKLPMIDMEEPLSGAEDNRSSQETQCLLEFQNVEYVRPAGVHSLQEWSQIKAEQGKHRNKTFGDIFETDLRYAMVMARKSTLTSTWALSFQGYSQARLKKMAQQQIKKSAESGDISDTDEWKLCKDKGKPETQGQTEGPMKGAAAPSTPATAARASSKRRSLPTTSTRMPVDMDKEQMRMRKVLLERELQLLNEAAQAQENGEAP